MLQLPQIRNKGRFIIRLGVMALLVMLCATSVDAEHNNLGPHKTIERSYLDWQAVINNDSLSETESHERVQDIIRQVLYFERFASQILQRTWKKITPYDQQQFVNAITASMAMKMAAKAHLYGKAKLILRKQELKEHFANLDYELDAGNRRLRLRVFMLKNAEGQWKISNLKVGDDSVLGYYYTYCKKLLKKYSFPYLIGELGDYGFVVLENFESSDVNALPHGWSWKSKDNNKHKPYRVREENGNKYLEATDEGESVILGKDVKWDLRMYPYVSFKWRVHRIPEGADERFHKKVDSAAGIYFVYKKKLGLIPESVKFVWSSTLPVGSAMQRSGVGRPWMVVAETGKDHLGEWRTYVFNAYEAYKDTFGGDPPRVPLGIGILSDANSMKSYAYADYDDIRVLKNAEADSGVKEILKAE